VTDTEKIMEVTSIFSDLGIREHVPEKIQQYYQDAIDKLAEVKLDDELKSNLKAIARKMIDRAK
jgi:geranylgeranyl diphosphate synthase type II